MKSRSTIAALLLSPTLLSAQHRPTAPPPVRSAPVEARQFAFLIGQWELVVKPQAVGLGQRIHGVPKLLGTWKAWRALDGWGITDELRITDESGNPRELAHAVRLYDATTRRWNVSRADVNRSTFQSSTGEWKDGNMTMTASDTDGKGKTFMSRARYFDITPTSFRFQQERSFDRGAKWTQTLSIEAKRVAAVAPRE